MSTFLYFAYGSNMLRERLLLANPSAVFVAVAKLKNYKLQFCVKHEWKDGMRATRWKGGVGTIADSMGDCVWGVVWKLKMSDLDSLKDQEGVHAGIYRPLNCLKVTRLTDQEPLQCISYQFIDPVKMKPSPQYLRVIQMGAIQNNLPPEYHNFLSSIEHNGYDGPLPIFDEVVKDAKL